MLLPVFSFGRVNYEDPNYSVGLPVFSIHGNHDDPAREGTMDVSTRGQAARWIACRMDRWSLPFGCCDGGSCWVVWVCQPLSAMDLLSVNNLVNYFGKCEETSNIEVGGHPTYHVCSCSASQSS